MSRPQSSIISSSARYLMYSHGECASESGTVLPSERTMDKRQAQLKEAPKDSPVGVRSLARAESAPGARHGLRAKLVPRGPREVRAVLAHQELLERQAVLLHDEDDEEVADSQHRHEVHEERITWESTESR